MSIENKKNLLYSFATKEQDYYKTARTIQGKYNKLSQYQEISKKVGSQKKIFQEKIEILEEQKRKRQFLLDSETKKMTKLAKQIKDAKDQESYIQLKEDRETASKFAQYYQVITFDIEKEQKDLITKNKNLEKLAQKNNEEIELVHQDKQKKEVEKKLKVIRAELNNIIKSLDNLFQKQYQKLYEEKISPAVIAIETNICVGCGVSFPIQHYQKMLVQHFIPCPHCKRLLVLKEDN